MRVSLQLGAFAAGVRAAARCPESCDKPSQEQWKEYVPLAFAKDEVLDEQDDAEGEEIDHSTLVW